MLCHDVLMARDKEIRQRQQPWRGRVYGEVDWRAGHTIVGDCKLQLAVGDFGWQQHIHLEWRNIIHKRRLPSEHHGDFIQRRWRGIAIESAGPTARIGRKIRSVDLDPGAGRDGPQLAKTRRTFYPIDGRSHDLSSTDAIGPYVAESGHCPRADAPEHNHLIVNGI